MTDAGFWPITPTPAPRQTSSDRWKRGRAVRPKVARYRAFCDECRLRHVWLPTPGDLVVFLMPMPRSWSEAKRWANDGISHNATPDADNLLKALLDAVYDDDALIWAITVAKVWSATPGIFIERRPAPIPQPFLIGRYMERPDHVCVGNGGGGLIMGPAL